MLSIYDGGANFRVHTVYTDKTAEAEFDNFADAVRYAYRALRVHGLECAVFTGMGLRVCRFYRFCRRAA